MQPLNTPSTPSVSSTESPLPVSGINTRQPAPLTVSRPELLTEGSDAKFRQLVHNMFALASRHESMRAGHGARIGLTGIEYTFLISVRHLEVEGDVSVKQLAEHLHLSGAFATTMIGKLIKRGLVTKEVDPGDRRRLSVKVTAMGHALLSELAPTQRQVNDIQFGCLSKSEFNVLFGLIERLIDSSDKALALQSYLAMHDLAGAGKT
ncbi:MarR family winged helix-turn-helix transcriptional regulator [Lacisediminimonas sp.]|uniref:MarR family winged helix-turn-helix transcriptional regulator n=1 Tax=Lacisediminimonas sp. TaxID=3060582 RepID=UPI00271F4362|nr:MarR family winged helix-turn-helix transcriptional regulator [Lacisediminimonas sp.]MDO8298349.1 MarR family winged helix-turn-helix transcriptional regulator [Lacisediminimonas sp.]